MLNYACIPDIEPTWYFCAVPNGEASGEQLLGDHSLAASNRDYSDSEDDLVQLADNKGRTSFKLTSDIKSS